MLTKTDRSTVSPMEADRIRNEFFGEFGVDVTQLDNSCVTQFTEAPKIADATMQCVHSMRFNCSPLSPLFCTLISL
jgi:hypothetical protein